MIKIIDPKTKKELLEHIEGLKDVDGILLYPKIKGVPRFVSDDNYTSNFGMEWNRFQTTQIDKHVGIDLSYKRFFAETRWKGNLEGENILEVGSGAGRFSQIVLDHTKANLYSVDYSTAVEANYRNNGNNERLHLFQANIYELPFEKNSFDKVFCFGVLQHTPNFEESVKCLIDMVKPGGELVVDFYPIKGWYTKINAKYMLRPITKKMSHDKLMKLITNNIGVLMSTYKFNKSIGLGVLNRFVPICSIDEVMPQDKEYNKEWAILDTFDMFSPQYDDPQRIKTVVKWFQKYGMTNVDGQFIQYEKGFEAATVKGTKALN